MTTPTPKARRELADRLKALTGPDRQTFWEAFAFCHPEPASNCEPAWRPENPKQPIYHAWKTREIAFRKYLDAEAWESAAVSLVPEGRQFGCGSLDGTLQSWAWVGVGGALDETYVSMFPANAATPALALVAASLHALANQGEG